MSSEMGRRARGSEVRVRPMRADDLDAADRIMRLAFGTFRGLTDPESTFGDAQLVRTRFRAAPDCAWVAEVDGEVVGSVLVARWGSFGFFGPLTIHPEHWDRGIANWLLEPVMEALARWRVRQAGLFTFADSVKHIGLYQKHGFWPRSLTAILAKRVEADADASYELFSQAARRESALQEIRGLTDAVFSGLDLGREILAVQEQRLGETVLLRAGGELSGMAVCHCGAGSEAGSGVCYVKFGAVRPGAGARDRFELLLQACEALASRSGLERLVAGVNTERLDAYRCMLDRGFRPDRVGLSMRLHPEGPDFDRRDDYVLDDLR